MYAKFISLPHIVAVVIIGLAVSCKPEVKLSERIEAMEQSYKLAPGPAGADSLAALYRQAALLKPEDAAANLHYLTRAADLGFLHNRSARTPARTVNEAIEKYGNGQDLADAMGLTARLWAEYKYKGATAAGLEPEDIDMLRAHLERYPEWVDSSLTRQRAQIGDTILQNKPAIERFIQTVEGYALAYMVSNTDRTAEWLIEAAGFAKNIGDPNKAVQLYYTVSERMPGHRRASIALFMQAFIYENDLGDMEKAKTTYQDFLKRYPKDEMADDAQNALKMLGKSPEEIIRSFEQK